MFADKLMYTGFPTRPAPACRSASTTWSSRTRRRASSPKAESRSAGDPEQYQSGLVTAGERYNKVVDIWSRTNEQVAKAMMEGIGTEKVRTPRARPSTRSR
jgi:DNA-directed RNA polymerase subunit beta'